MKFIGNTLKWIGGLTVFLIALAIFFGPVEEHHDDVRQASAAENSAGQEIVVPSDPRAKYWVQRIDARADGAVEIQTRRAGPSGESFAIRKVECSPLRFGYVADSDTEVGLLNRIDNPEMSTLVDGSISDVVSRFACDNAPRKEANG